MYVRLLDIPPDQAREIGGFMRLFVSGSAPLPAQIFEEFRERFGHAVLERYGMSETLMNISNPYVGERRPGSVGLPLPGVSVRLLDSEGQPVADGEIGEVYLKGPNIFAGYWRRDEATRAAFVDGYFRTGDIATRSPDGYYTLCGRKSDLIISGGFNIYPREIEEFLQEQDGVAEAAVAAAPDRVRGEVPVAYIVTTRAIDPADLEACLPRETGIVQSSALVHPGRQTAAQRAGQSAKASPTRSRIKLGPSSFLAAQQHLDPAALHLVSLAVDCIDRVEHRHLDAERGRGLVDDRTGAIGAVWSRWCRPPPISRYSCWACRPAPSAIFLIAASCCWSRKA